MRRVLKTASTAFANQYASYVIVDDIHINSKLTSGEDVADLGGTLLAYIAWKKQTAGQTLTERCRRLHAGPAVFFVGMAQWACENERPENLRVSAVTNPHSPGFARINGVVSNMPEFAEGLRLQGRAAHGACAELAASGSTAMLPKRKGAPSKGAPFLCARILTTGYS